MSTRWYPLYKKGNPQLRVFLPNFTLKLLKPKSSEPTNVVKFQCSMEMSNHDIKNYLEKIYKIPVVSIRTYIHTGKFRKALGKEYIVKDDDERIAVVAMPPNELFSFPDIFPAEKEEKELKDYEQFIKEREEGVAKQADKKAKQKGIPTWFSM